METLYVLYDDRCGVCTQLKSWLQQQPAYVAFRFVAIGSAAARDLFPSLPPGSTDLAVIADSGEAWIGDRAWIIVLWALRQYRGLSEKFASPALLPLARQAFLSLSRNRYAVSQFLGLPSEDHMRRFLTEEPLPPCQI